MKDESTRKGVVQDERDRMKDQQGRPEKGLDRQPDRNSNRELDKGGTYGERGSSGTTGTDDTRARNVGSTESGWSEESPPRTGSVTSRSGTNSE